MADLEKKFSLYNSDGTETFIIKGTEDEIETINNCPIADTKAREDIQTINTQFKDIANLSLTKHIDGKVYIKKQDGTLLGDGIEIGGSDVDLSKITMSMSGQTLKLLNDGIQIATVEIPTNTVTDEQIDSAVSSYLTAHPVTGGLTSTQITALENMFKVCAYDSSKDVNSAYNAFKTAFNISSGGGTDPEPVEKTKYTITNNLTDVTTNNTTSEIEEGSTYKATLSTSVNYAIKTITITMGGNDVTSIVYADGVINIGSVTGNIIITATAESTKVTPESLGFETLFEYDDVYNKDAVVAKYGANGLVTYNYEGAVTVACYYNSVNNTSPAPNMNNVFDGRAYGSITYMSNGDGTKSGGVKKLKDDLVTSYAYKNTKTPKCYGCYATGTNSGKIQIFATQYKAIDVETPSVDTHVRILIIKGTDITAEQLCTIFRI